MSNITESWQEREQKCPFLQNDTDYCHCEREANRNYNEVPSSPVRTELWKCEEQLGRQLVRLRTAGGGRGLTRGAGLVPLTQQPRRPLPGHPSPTVLLDAAPPPRALCLASGFNSPQRHTSAWRLLDCVGLRLTGVGAQGRAWGSGAALASPQVAPVTLGRHRPRD